MESTQRMAEQIETALTGCKVVNIPANDFSGTDILPADVCFFGCESPDPPSFAHLEEVLRHINLAGRPCGLFSPESGRVLEYLSGIVRDSELALHAEPLFSSGAGRIKHWVKDLIN
jgi:hypothetical protein